MKNAVTSREFERCTPPLLSAHNGYCETLMACRSRRVGKGAFAVAHALRRRVGKIAKGDFAHPTRYAVLRFSSGTIRASASSVDITSPKKIAKVLSVPACSSSVQVALPSEIIATR